MKYLFPYLLLAVGLAACRHNDPDVQPVPTPGATVNTQAANYDILAKDTGHWQWVSTAAGFNRKDSTTVGYGRQVLFKSDSTLALSRTSQPNLSAPYSLTNVLFSCGGRTVKCALFNTNEFLLPPTRPRRMTVSAAGPNGSYPMILLLQTDNTCTDGGYMERYNWVHER
ncbi:MAG: hypothetical protein ACRYFZ_13225 [Janthinobacterium lividum]